MFNEIWGSKKETYEGINDHDEELHDEKQRLEELEQETARILADIELIALEEEELKKEKAAGVMLQKSHELLKFIDEHFEYLSLVSEFKRENYKQIELYSKMSIEEIKQNKMVEEVWRIIDEIEHSLEIVKQQSDDGKSIKEQKIKISNELITKIIELKHFVEQKRDVLDLNSNFNENDVNDILMLLELNEDEIIESYTYSDIEGLLMKLDMQLGELRGLYDSTVSQVLRYEGFISTVIGVNFVNDIQLFLKEIENPKLREEYNDKYLLVLDAIFKEYSKSRDRVVCREMFIEFYDEVDLLMQMQTSLFSAKDIIDRYDKKEKNSQKLYLNKNNCIDVSVDMLPELLMKGDFDVLIQDAKTIPSQRIVQYPTIDKNGEQILIPVRREEKKVISSSYQLNPKEFIEKNAEVFCYMLNSYNCQKFISSMNSFINKLKNNQIKDHSNEVIQTRNIGLELESEFLMFLLVNLYKLHLYHQREIYYLLKNKMVSTDVDLEMLFVMLAMKPNNKNNNYFQLIEHQIGLMTDKQQNVFSKYLNVSKEVKDLSVKNTL